MIPFTNVSHTLTRLSSFLNSRLLVEPEKSSIPVAMVPAYSMVWIDQPYTDRDTFSIKMGYNQATGNGSLSNVVALASIIDTQRDIIRLPESSITPTTVKKAEDDTHEAYTYEWQGLRPAMTGHYAIHIVIEDSFGNNYGTTTSNPFTII